MVTALLRAVCFRLGALLGLGSLLINPVSGQINVVWTGAINTDWHNAANWLPPVVPELCSHYVIIPHTANQPVISSIVNVGRIQLADSVRLVLNADLTVCGDWIGPDNDEAFVEGTGKVLMDGMHQWLHGYTAFHILALRSADTTRMDTGSHIDITYKLNLTNGVFDATRGVLRFPSSSATDYTILDNFSPGFVGRLHGTAIVERYIPVNGLNQHFFGTPVSNTSFADLGASGTPGYIIPTFNCDQSQSAPNSPYGHIFQWHDDVPENAICHFNGWEVKTTGMAEPGRAYSIYLNGGLFTLTGTINQDSAYSIGGLNNIGWASNTLQTAGFNPPAFESGWHLVANPYLAPLQLNGHTPDFDAAAVWMTNGPFTGTYQPVAITGGIIPPFQGFAVHRSDSAATNFTFRKSEGVDVTGQAFYKQAGATALNILVNGNGFNDITYVQYNGQATSGYDVNLDNRKPLSGAGRPTLYTYNVNATPRLAVNVNRSIAETPQVHLNFIPGSNGTFTLHVNGISSFDPTTYIWLEDTKTGNRVNLRQQTDYTFQSTTSDAHSRFVLHFTPEAVFSVIDAGCLSPGQLTVQQPGNTTWNYTLATGNDVLATGLLNAASPISLSLLPGIYTVTLSDTLGYTVIKNVMVQGTPQAVASISASRQTAEVGEEIVFTGPATALSYTWDLGDDTQETAPVVAHSFNGEGVYNVLLVVTMPGNCSAATTLPVTITTKTATAIETPATPNALRIYAIGNEVVVDFANSQKGTTQIDIYNLLGQTILHDRHTAENGGQYHKVLSDVSDGYLIVQLRNEAGVTSQKLFINHL